ncbi:outer membrane lipoprotein-sorting protein [Vibrio vulnificus]|nr:outer membrane lipoprotein-sorting protein [Vibrio vulnificus]EHH2471430.1 outer membrane lipoprotein-sorting protein [Vibrio vulnificus]EHI9298837.1 outer membrane lipoprotein-sorting protein [Vibrio vulnificus]EHU5127111.1 outer membrane lipoprotein-sorting protein [Vibrio vulnificus]EHW0626228.1 outer membrane lipoprotein-sorting protein [Vibrio vulnificus]
MFNFPILLQSVVLSLMLFCVPILAQPNQQNIESMIKRADDYRLKEESARVISLVSLYENDELDKTREYHVYTRPNRESLVIFKSAVEAGQKMLMLQDNYWLQMPKSRRPIRITPMQKLLGEASVGDISTLTWSEDYQGIWVASEKVQGLAGESVATQRLQLTAKTSGASYQTIDLWLTVPEHFPLKADLYLRSGKLAKQAWFTRGERNGELSVTEMTLLDHIQPAKKTVIEYQDVQPWQLEDKFYNPSYLSKADSVQF